MVTTRADVVDPNDGLISLREAITMANATAAADTIVLQGGMYAIGIDNAGEDANAGGDFDITNPLTLIGRGAAATAIDGAQLDRVFDVLGSFNVQFSNLTVQNGHEDDDSVAGAGINADDANITLNNSAVRRNTCTSGAGIWAGSGNVTLNNSAVTNNIADDDGGGIFAGDGDVTLNNSTVRGNRAANGGGIYARSGDVTLTDSRVTGNTAAKPLSSLANGGGIDAESGNVTLVRVTVDHNRASANGGGLYVPDGTLTLRGSTVRLNVVGLIAVEGGFLGERPPAVGGGVFANVVNAFNSTVSRNFAIDSGGGINAVTATLTNSTVSGNQARTGGGVFATTATLTGSTVSDNTAGIGDGGGVKAGTVTLIRSTVSGNSATFGGGVSGTTVSASDSTISGNNARGTGGGIKATTANLTNCTVSGNNASGGGGVVAQGGTLLNCTIVENFAGANGGGVLWTAGADRIHLKNTIVADNLVLTVTNVGQDVSGDFISDGHNLIGVVDGATGFGAPGDQLGTGDQPLDPRLGPLANNGGPTQTHALLPGSLAIDRGDNNGATIADQRGVGRNRDGDGNGSSITDIGAFER